jgi:hypothetical protein
MRLIYLVISCRFARRGFFRPSDSHSERPSGQHQAQQNGSRDNFIQLRQSKCAPRLHAGDARRYQKGISMTHTSNDRREVFDDAVEAMIKWRGRGPEPIGLDQACAQVSRCSDTMPGWMRDQLEEFGARTGTYAAGARAMRVWLRRCRGAPAA